LKSVIRQYNTSESKMVLLNLLKKWIDLDRLSFQESATLGPLIGEFIGSLKDDKLALRLKQSIEGVVFVNEDEDSEEDKLPTIVKKSKKSDGRPAILNFDAQEMARQMTVYDFELLEKVDRKEMLKTRWLSPDKAPTLKGRSDHTNQLAYWVAFELLNTKPRYRRKMLVHFLKVCHYLMEIWNYQSLMGFYLGLSFTPVSNCLTLWSALPSKIKGVWTKVTKLMDYQNNYANFRDATTARKPPSDVTPIPCQEIILKDLLFCYEAFPDLEGDTTNLEKMHAVGSKIDEFRRFQEAKLVFLKYEPIYTIISNLPKNITMETIAQIGQAPKSTLGVDEHSLSESSASTASFLESMSEREHGSALVARKRSANKSPSSHHDKSSSPQNSSHLSSSTKGADDKSEKSKG